MDEKVMVMEQERLAQEKKRKRNHKKLRIVGVAIVAAIIGGVWYLGWGRHLGDTEESTIQITTTLGQEVIYAGLTSVKGNEITYLVAHERSTEEEMSQVESDIATASTSNSEIPGAQEGEWQNGSSQRGERPDMSEMDGEMPNRSEMPDKSEVPNMGEIPDMSGFMEEGTFQMGAAGNAANNFLYHGVTYELTEESVTMLIPVGTDVITKLGTVTTFSRLAAGDKVALVVEEQKGEQTIAAVYIID